MGFYYCIITAASYTPEDIKDEAFSIEVPDVFMYRWGNNCCIVSDVEKKVMAQRSYTRKVLSDRATTTPMPRPCVLMIKQMDDDVFEVVVQDLATKNKECMFTRTRDTFSEISCNITFLIDEYTSLMGHGLIGYPPLPF